MSVTISDVAPMAGVSPITASRALSDGPHPVAKETRRKVLAAAEELGYIEKDGADNGEWRHVLLEPRLILRASCGARS